jgi:hypothetical protein
MDHNIIHIKMEVWGVVHEFQIQKSWLLKTVNDFVHHVDIQVKIFKPSPF